MPVQWCISFLCKGFLKDIKAKSEVAMFAIYLLSEQSEQKIYMSYMATKGVALNAKHLYPKKYFAYELLNPSFSLRKAKRLKSPF